MKTKQPVAWLMLGAVSCAVVSAACRPNPAEEVSASRATKLTATALPSGAPALKARMRDHDLHAGAMRDAVARADLEAARREARVLAELRSDGTIDPPWRRRLDALNLAAARLAESTDLTEASTALGVIARTCGDCHAMLGGPSFVVGEPPDANASVAARMRRHRWAVSRMWDGIVAPSDDAWAAGARVLADAPLEPEKFAPGIPAPEVRELASAVHELGRKAATVDTRIGRGQLYGELIATCSACHERLSRSSREPTRR